MTEPVAVMVLLAIIVISCGNGRQPRPRAYFRIDFPERSYRVFDDSSCPFKFEYPVYGTVNESGERDAEPCWFDIDFADFRARIHLSYKPVNNNLAELLEDSYSLVYNHTIKADAIREVNYNDHESGVFGLLYDLKGNTATAVQFFVTDSTNHFMRGALYFYASPNEDSLAPVIEFFRQDIVHLVETIRWKE